MDTGYLVHYICHDYVQIIPSENDSFLQVTEAL